MTREQVQEAINAARKEFDTQGWGYSDELVVDAFVELLKEQLDEQRDD